MQNKTIFVTGATGYIGTALCHRLLSEGAQVRGLARDAEKGRALARAGVEIVLGDITDHARMTELLDGVDIVYHLAAQLREASAEVYEQVNVAATRHLAEASAQAGVQRFVFTSSMMAIGPINKGEVAVETRPLRYYGERYGDSKVDGERALHDVARTTGLQVVITRPGMVFGPQARTWTLRIFNWVRQGTAPVVDGGRGTSYPIYIDNLVDGLILAGTQPGAAGEVFNFVDDRVTWAEYYGAFQRMLGKRRMGIPLPFGPLYLAAHILDPLSARRSLPYLVTMLAGRGAISNQKAKDVLSWQPRVSFEEGMRRTQDWLREAGHL